MPSVIFRLIIVIFILGIFLPAHAQESSLSTLEAHYQSFKSWRLNFTQTSHIEALNQDLVKEGQILAIRPHHLRIDYVTEPKKSYLYNGQKLWIYHDKTGEADEFAQASRVLSSEALSFLSGLDRMSEFFVVVDDLKEADGTLKIKDSTLKKMALLPKNESAAVLRLTLGIDTKDKLIREAVLFNASGNVTHYQFHNIETNVALTEISFALPDHAKVNVVK